MTPNSYPSDFALEIIWFKLSSVPQFSAERGPQAHLNRRNSLSPYTICFGWEKMILVVSKAKFIYNPFIEKNMKHKNYI